MSAAQPIPRNTPSLGAAMDGDDRLCEVRPLAADVRDSLQHEAGMPRSNYIGKGTAFSVRSDLGTLNFAQVAAIMMEMGNMMNTTDAKVFTSASWRAKAATALVDGIEKFLG